MAHAGTQDVTIAVGDLSDVLVEHVAYSPLTINATYSGIDVSSGGTLVVRDVDGNIVITTHATAVSSTTLRATTLAGNWATNLTGITRYYGDMRVTGYGNPLPWLAIDVRPAYNRGSESYTQPTIAEWREDGTKVGDSDSTLYINFRSNIVATADGQSLNIDVGETPDATARAGVASNSANIAVLQTGKVDVVTFAGHTNNLTNPHQVTLQQVTDNGATTTNSITVPSVNFGSGVVLSYDSEERTQSLSFAHPDGGTVTINGELYRMWKNIDTVAITNGQPVCLFAGSGRVGTIKLADADDTTRNKLVGVYTGGTPLAVGAIGRITTRGAVESFNIRALMGEGTVTEGSRIYLHTTAGTYTTNAPSAPVDGIQVGVVTYLSPSPGNSDLEVAILGCKEWSELDARYASSTDYDAELTYQHNANSSGRLWGGIITATNGTTLNIAAGGGWSKTDAATLTDIPTNTTDGLGSSLEYVTWDATNLTALTGYNIVFYDASSGTITNCLKADMGTYFDFSRDFTLGRTYYDPLYGPLARLCGMNEWSKDRRQQIFHEEIHPVEVGSGGVPSASGLQIAVTAAGIWAEGENYFSTTAKATGDNFYYWFKTNNVWTFTATTDIDNTNYNNVNAADGIAALTVNRWRADYIYLVHDGSVHVVKGQAQYVSQALAEAAARPVPPDICGAYATLIGRITVKKGESTMTVDVVDTVSFSATAVPEHSELAGLQGGTTDEYYHLTSAELGEVQGMDSTYLPLAGGTMTGDIDLNGNTITNSNNSAALKIKTGSIFGIELESDIGGIALESANGSVFVDATELRVNDGLSFSDSTITNRDGSAQLVINSGQALGVKIQGDVGGVTLESEFGNIAINAPALEITEAFTLNGSTIVTNLQQTLSSSSNAIASSKAIIDYGNANWSGGGAGGYRALATPYDFVFPTAVSKVLTNGFTVIEWDQSNDEASYDLSFKLAPTETNMTLYSTFNVSGSGGVVYGVNSEKWTNTVAAANTPQEFTNTFTVTRDSWGRVDIAVKFYGADAAQTATDVITQDLLLEVSK